MIKPIFGRRKNFSVQEFLQNRYAFSPEILQNPKYGFLLKALNINSDSTTNLLPTMNDIELRMRIGKAELDEKLALIHKNFADDGRPEVRVKPYSLIPSICWTGDMGDFLVVILGLNQCISWNIAYLPVDKLSASILDAPLHPNCDIPAFVEASRSFYHNWDKRLLAATKTTIETKNMKFYDTEWNKINNEIIALAMYFLQELANAHKEYKLSGNG